jgi:hypothetical protein
MSSRRASRKLEQGKDAFLGETYGGVLILHPERVVEAEVEDRTPQIGAKVSLKAILGPSWSKKCEKPLAAIRRAVK